MEPIPDIPVYESRLLDINNVMTSLLRRVEDISQGLLGEIVDESKIKWGAALLQHLTLRLEKIRKDGEEQCALLRGLCVEYTQRLEKLRVEQHNAEEERTAARLARIKFEDELQAIRTEQGGIVSSVKRIESTMEDEQKVARLEQGTIVSSLKKIEGTIENNQKTARTEQGVIVSSLKKIVGTMEDERKAIRTEHRSVMSSLTKVENIIDTRIGTKVADIVTRFERLEVQSKDKKHSDLKKATEDRRSLQTSLSRLGSVVASKDEVILGLHDQIDSLDAKLAATDSVLAQERINNKNLHQKVENASSLAQTQIQEIAKLTAARDDLNHLIAQRDDELRVSRGEAGEARTMTSRQHEEEISLKDNEIRELSTARQRVEQLTREKDDIVRKLEQVTLSGNKATQDNQDSMAKFELMAKKEANFADEITKLSDKLALATQKEEQLVQEKALISLRLNKVSSKETELERECTVLSDKVVAAECKGKVLVQNNKKMAKQLRVADEAIERLRNDIDRNKERRPDEQRGLATLANVQTELRDKRNSAADDRGKARDLETKLRAELQSLRLDISDKDISMKGLELQLQSHQAVAEREKAAHRDQVLILQDESKQYKVRLETLQFVFNEHQKDCTTGCISSKQAKVRKPMKDLHERQAKRPRVDKINTELNK